MHVRFNSTEIYFIMGERILKSGLIEPGRFSRNKIALTVKHNCLINLIKKVRGEESLTLYNYVYAPFTFYFHNFTAILLLLF